MLELGKELTSSDTSSVQAAPKVNVTVGDQPGEMAKYTPYTSKGESYRLDPICGDIDDALFQSRNNKKASRTDAALFLNRRYAAVYSATKSWTGMTLSKECMGFTNAVEEAVDTRLRDIEEADSDLMFSYVLGKFDAKFWNQACLVSLRKSYILRCINPEAEFVSEIIIADMFMAFSRMKVRNWYVRGVINHIHYGKELERTRLKITPEEELQAKVMVDVLSHVNDDGEAKHEEVAKGLRQKQGTKKYAKQEEYTKVLKLMHSAGVDS